MSPVQSLQLSGSSLTLEMADRAAEDLYAGHKESPDRQENVLRQLDLVIHEIADHAADSSNPQGSSTQINAHQFASVWITEKSSLLPRLLNDAKSSDNTPEVRAHAQATANLFVTQIAPLLNLEGASAMGIFDQEAYKLVQQNLSPTVARQVEAVATLSNERARLVQALLFYGNRSASFVPGEARSSVPNAQFDPMTAAGVADGLSARWVNHGFPALDWHSVGRRLDDASVQTLAGKLAPERLDWKLGDILVGAGAQGGAKRVEQLIGKLSADPTGSGLQETLMWNSFAQQATQAGNTNVLKQWEPRAIAELFTKKEFLDAYQSRVKERQNYTLTNFSELVAYSGAFIEHLDSRQIASIVQVTGMDQHSPKLAQLIEQAQTHDSRQLRADLLGVASLHFEPKDHDKPMSFKNFEAAESESQELIRLMSPATLRARLSELVQRDR